MAYAVTAYKKSSKYIFSSYPANFVTCFCKKGLSYSSARYGEFLDVSYCYENKVEKPLTVKLSKELKPATAVGNHLFNDKPTSSDIINR